MKTIPTKQFARLMLSEASQAPSDGPRPSRTSARSLNCVMAPAITKAPDRKPTVGKTSVRGRSGERLLIHTYSEDDFDSYELEVSIMSTVARIPALANHAPRLIQADPDSRVVVLSGPRRRWFPLLCYLRSSMFGLEQLLELKQTLRQYVELLYNHGVAYRVKYNFIFPYQKSSGRWVLHLAGWLDAGYCSDSAHLESTEWKERKTKQMNEIERIFGLIVMNRQDIQDAKEDKKQGVKRDVRTYRVNPWELQELLLPQDDK